METDMRTISRDPFARHDIVREQVPANGKTCAWCGSVKRHPTTNRGYLYQYGVWPDAGPRTWDSKLFCSISCRRIYYGE